MSFQGEKADQVFVVVFVENQIDSRISVPSAIMTMSRIFEIIF